MRETLRSYCRRMNLENLPGQWDAEGNLPLTADDISYGSRRKVWWRCGKGHDYESTVAARTMRGSGCPYCSGKKVLPGFNDLATLDPEVARQWHPALNDALTPRMVTAGSHRKVWWECELGHV